MDEYIGQQNTYFIGQKVSVDGKAMNLYGRCPIDGTIEKFEERPSSPKFWVNIKLRKNDKIKGITMRCGDMEKFVKSRE